MARVGAPVEGIAAHKWGGLAADTQRPQHLPVQSTFSDRVVAIVGTINSIIRSHGDAVGPGEHSLAPGAEKVALAIEHDHRVLSPVEGVNVILGVGADGGNFFEAPSIRESAPAFCYLVGVSFRAQCYHAFTSLNTYPETLEQLDFRLYTRPGRPVEPVRGNA